ncbi:splicing factor 3B subunit 1-like [Dorcoceras hygrometricum]|uniref:Splicing factor 3B subunit 1-like n=1 Tax=Dorcoceras hygrometricum TaxID=472368 RepID=A0A2Z7BJC8_9LAMI|nr:splicing factor 3B subunit 1-like [Dorcoceras hygrometricum]
MEWLMFRALESTGFHGFLGFPSVLYEKELEQFFDTALVKDNEILCVIRSKVAAITEDRSGEPVKTSCKKRKMKYEFRLLNDILAKSVTVKVGSFDAVTHERFDMADKSSKRAKGYAAQICVLLKGDPAVNLEEVKTFPPLKILSAKTVGTYVATNKTIDARGESDEPDVAKVAVVERKSVSKKRSASTANKDTDELCQLSVLMLKKHKAPRRKLRLSTGSDDEIVETEIDVENVVEKQKEKTTVDDVDKIIDQVLTETAQLETDVVEPDVAEGVATKIDLAEPMVTRSDDIVVEITEHSIAVNDEDDNLDGDENEIARTMASVIAPKQFLKEPLRSGEDDDISGVEQPSKIIDTEEDSVKNKETYIQLVETETGKDIDPEPVADVG